MPSLHALTLPAPPIQAPTDVPTVYVIDGDVSARESLARLIKSAGLRPETFASGSEFLSRLRPVAPCCLILDVALPGISGLELQKQLADHAYMPIIFVSGYADVPMTVRAMRAGAMDVLTKPLRNEVLLAALGGAIARSRGTLSRASEVRVLQIAYETLTPREREVMALVVSGLLNKQIGGELGISEITVKAHRGQVMRKMKAESLPALVTMAVRLGLRRLQRQ